MSEDAADLRRQLAHLYRVYLANLDPDARAALPVSDRWVLRDWMQDVTFPITSYERLLAHLTKLALERYYGTALPHVPYEELVDVAAEAYEDDASDIPALASALAPNPPSALPHTRAIFDELMDELDDGPFGDFGELRLACDPKAAEGGDRQFAYCMAEDDMITIAFAPRAEQLPRTRLLGLMAHEMGHAIDFRYPRRELESRLGVELPSGVERRADVIAEHAFGRRIEYDADDVQCIGCRGRHPRPTYLAQ